MASTINATSTGSGGLITTGSTVNQLELQTGDTTRLIVDSTGNVTIQGQGDLRLMDSDSTHYVALQAAGTVTSNVTFTLPSADGTSGQVLQTNGSGELSFATPAGGSWTYLSTVTASSSSTIDIENTFDSTYDTYAIIASGVTVSADAQIRCRLKINGSYQTDTYYCYHQLRSAEDGSSYSYDRAFSPSSMASSILFVGDGVKTGSGAHCEFELRVSNVTSTSFIKTINWSGRTITTTAESRVGWFLGAARYNSSGSGGTAALTGIRFFPDSGNFSTGSFRLYGIKNS